MVQPESDYYRLRTEWLRYKGQLFDGLTGLPVLASILDDLRRMLESCGSLDVVYLDLGRSGRQEMALGWAAYDEAVREFSRLLLRFQDEGLLSAQDRVCLHTVRSDRFLVFLPGATETTRPATVRRERLVAALRGRIVSGLVANPLRGIGFAAGYSRISEDPRLRAERAIQRGVSEAMLMSLVEGEGIETVRRNELCRMIFEGDVRTVFHPIVRLNDLDVVGHEALTRPIGGVPFDSVEHLFSYAESTELLLDFERLCRKTAIRAASGLPRLGLLFLNASARAVEDPEWAGGGMDEALAGSGLAPKDVVVEITERVAITRHDEFRKAMGIFKERGYRVAVDDVGAGYASFQALASIEPDFLKFDVSLVRDIDRSRIKRSLLESLRQLGTKIGARVIAEGVERAEERQVLLDLGIELGQGFHFHREEPLS